MRPTRAVDLRRFRPEANINTVWARCSRPDAKSRRHREGMSSSRLSSQRLFAHRLACQRAMAMPPDTTAVIVGSAHCGGEVGGVREYITDECCNRADRRLSRGAIDCPVHLCKEGDRNGRTDNPANRGEECVIETKRGQNVSARHYEKAGEPRPSKLFSGGARKPSCTQIIESIEDAELKASHR
jgi:hypothetical protein